MNEQDPERHNMQPPIPSQPPATVAPGDEDKVAASGRKPGEPPSGSPGLGSGHAIDEGVGGAGLGKAPGEGDAGTRDRDTRAGNP